MKSQLIVALTIPLISSQVHAGPLGEVNRDIGQHQASVQSERAGGSAAGRPSGYDPTCATQQGVRYREQAAPYSGFSLDSRPQPTSAAYVPAPVTVFALATYANIEGSDGALSADLRVAHGGAALAFSSSSFFESDRAAKGEPMEESRLTRWEIAIQGRALHRDATSVWLGVGLGQLHGTGFETATGASATIHLQHRLAKTSLGSIGLDTQARAMLYRDDLKAGELRAGLTASIVYLGYRHLKFNVGPALAGPEAGVALRF